MTLRWKVYLDDPGNEQEREFTGYGATPQEALQSLRDSIAPRWVEASDETARLGTRVGEIERALDAD